MEQKFEQLPSSINGNADWHKLKTAIQGWGKELGFSHTAVSDINLEKTQTRLNDWLEQGFHGDMDYMQKHGSRRTHPDQLIPGTLRVITVRMDYLTEPMDQAITVLQQADKGYVSRYALGRDYHKVMRQRLKALAGNIHRRMQRDFRDNHATLGNWKDYRVFCDSAPVMEKALAEKSGHGWIGKHTNLINRTEGSWFFLGELYTNLPLPVDSPTTDHCGSCQACINVCPTDAIIAPYQLDARKCISYLTIEHHGSIPIELRAKIGNRIYGCDDCQLVCPWNRYAKPTAEADFKSRHQLDNMGLSALFNWSKEAFLKRTEGSAIRRIGYQRWLRNIAVAMGNAPNSGQTMETLRNASNHSDLLVREHVQWALENQLKPASQTTNKRNHIFPKPPRRAPAHHSN